MEFRETPLRFLNRYNKTINYLIKINKIIFITFFFKKKLIRYRKKKDEKRKEKICTCVNLCSYCNEIIDMLIFLKA